MYETTLIVPCVELIVGLFIPHQNKNPINCMLESGRIKKTIGSVEQRVSKYHGRGLAVHAPLGSICFSIVFFLFFFIRLNDALRLLTKRTGNKAILHQPSPSTTTSTARPACPHCTLYRAITRCIGGVERGCEAGRGVIRSGQENRGNMKLLIQAWRKP